MHPEKSRICIFCLRPGLSILQLLAFVGIANALTVLHQELIAAYAESSVKMCA